MNFTDRHWLTQFLSILLLVRQTSVTCLEQAMTNAELTQLERIAIENSLLLSGSGGGQLYHEQYDEHGVKIEYQCFK